MFPKAALRAGERPCARSLKFRLSITLAATAAVALAGMLGFAQNASAHGKQRHHQNHCKVTPEGVSLDGHWQFLLGDDPVYADPGFDDSSWEEVLAPLDAGQYQLD